MDAFQDRPLRVEKITVVALAGKAIICQAAVGAGAGPPPAAQVEAQLLTAAITPGTGVGALKPERCSVIYLYVYYSICIIFKKKKKEKYLVSCIKIKKEKIRKTSTGKSRCRSIRM